MKKKCLWLAALCFVAFTANATVSGKRFYINPGHGSFSNNDRPAATIPYPNLPTTGMPDTCGFYESNTNLWKCMELGRKLQSYGATVVYSRTACGPWDYVYPYSNFSQSAYKARSDINRYNKALSTICAEVNSGNFDYFVSVHSNAASDGSTANFPLFLYRGKDNNNYTVGDSKARATKVWPFLYECMASGLDPATSTNTFNTNNPNVRGDIDFYGSSSTSGYLGALRHNCPGWLSEGYFHTYQPARHRALNHDYCKQEGIRYLRGIMDYYGSQKETVGYIMGTVKDAHNKINNTLFKYAANSNDQWMPLNGAVVILKKAGVEIARYTVDNKYNGIFYFPDLAPGNDYSLDAYCEGCSPLADQYKGNLTVTANKTTYPMIFLEEGSYTPPEPEPEQPEQPIVARVYAYNLTMEHANGVYTFHFNTNADVTSAQVLLYKGANRIGVVQATVTNKVGTATINESNLNLYNGEEATWKVQVSGDAVPVFGQIHASDVGITRGFCSVDNSPESDYFGRIYILDRAGSASANNGFHVFNPDYTRVNTTVLKGGRAMWGSCYRTFVDDQGYVWMADGSDAYSGIFVLDPANINGNCEEFFAGSTRASSGLLTYNGVEVGSSCLGLSIYGSGADAKLLSVNEDAGGSLLACGLSIYNIGNANGTYQHIRTTAPEVNFELPNQTAAVDGYPLGCSHGVWVATRRAEGQNTATAVALKFYTWTGEELLSSAVSPYSSIINGCTSGAIALSPDESRLIMIDGSKNLLYFDVTWTGDQPTLSLRTKFNCGMGDVREMHFDYAGNLICSGGDRPATTDLVVFTVPTDNNTTITPAKHTLVLTKAGAAEPPAVADRIYYELNGGEVVTPTNAELWEQFKPAYNHYYTAHDTAWQHRSEDTPITNVAGFVINGVQAFMTSEDSPWKWLGDYILRVVPDSLRPASEVIWRYTVDQFFNCAGPRTAYPRNVATFETSGQPNMWRDAWLPVLGLPSVVSEAFELLQPVKEGYDFLGWYDNPNFTGQALTFVNDEFEGTLYAKWALTPSVLVHYELNGGEVATPTLDALWAEFMPAFDTYYDSARAERPRAEAAIFMHKAQAFMTDPASPFYWLGKYCLAAAEAQGWELTTYPAAASDELYWRHTVARFFNQAAGSSYPVTASFDGVYGEVSHWAPYYQEEVLPATITETLTLPIPVKEGYTFNGWYNNAEFTGNAITTLEAGYRGTLYAKWTGNAPVGQGVVYELNGGAVVPPSLAELWAAFMPAYNTYYGLARAEQTIDKVATFATAKVQAFVTDPASPFYWLGQYCIAAATAQGKSLTAYPATATDELVWRYTVQRFFNQADGSDYPVGPSFNNEWGEVATWAPYYQEAALPNQITAVLTLPELAKEGYTFAGWYDNAEFTGDAITTLAVGYEGTVYAKWIGGSPTGLDEIATSGIYYRQGVLYNPNQVMLYLYSATGQLMATGKNDIDMQAMPYGVYMARTQNEVLKFVK